MQYSQKGERLVAALCYLVSMPAQLAGQSHNRTRQCTFSTFVSAGLL